MILNERVVLAQGLSASPGCVSGKARVILQRAAIGEFEDGEILFAENIPPEWLPLIRRAKAIVTDNGGITCHASIVSRELGVPCIVGTGGTGKPATKKISTGLEVIVDASHGIVYSA